MADILVLHTSDIPGYRGRIHLLYPSLHIDHEPSAEMALERLANEAQELGGEAVLGASVYAVGYNDRSHAGVYYNAYGTVVRLQWRFPPWV